MRARGKKNQEFPTRNGAAFTHLGRRLCQTVENNANRNNTCGVGWQQHTFTLGSKLDKSGCAIQLSTRSKIQSDLLTSINTRYTNSNTLYTLSS